MTCQPSQSGVFDSEPTPTIHSLLSSDLIDFGRLARSFQPCPSQTTETLTMPIPKRQKTKGSKNDGARSNGRNAKDVATTEATIDEHLTDPVVTIRLDDADKDGCNGKIDISSKSLFETLVYPVTKDDFLRTYFRRKALHLRQGHGSDRHKDLIENHLQDLDPSFLLHETSSENVFVWVVPNANDDDSKATSSKIHSLEFADPQQAVLLHAAGHATYCRAPPSVEQPMVANMLHGTGLGCGQYDPSGTGRATLGRGEVEIFMGTASHTTQWHYDFQENFTIQLSGSKRWTLQESTVRYPLRGCTPHYADADVVESQLKAAHLGTDRFVFGQPQEGINAVGPTRQVLLTAGDVLYFPAGMWHKVETVEPGVSLNVSLMATNYGTIVCQALQHLLLKQDKWRETIVGENVLDNLTGLLQELPNIVSDFSRNGGAQSILPPVLRHPPSFVPIDEDDDGGDEDGGDAGDGDEDDNSQEQEEMMEDGSEPDPGESNGDGDDDDKKDNGNTGKDNQNDKEDDKEGAAASLEERFGTPVLDVNDSVSMGSTEWHHQRPSGEAQLVLNPLAWIRPLKDVTEYYAEDDRVGQHKHLYLLNVNYAGNEMHESSVRCIIRDEEDPLRLRQIQDDVESSKDLTMREQCYLFHGLYIWRE